MSSGRGADPGLVADLHGQWQRPWRGLSPDERGRAMVVGVLMIAVAIWWVATPVTDPATTLLAGVEVPVSLMEHSKEFSKPEVVEVTDGIYVAIGYALGNSIMLEAPEGVVIVDTTESVESGREVYEAFRQVTDKPVKGIIYTHFHADHVNGAEAFVDDLSNPPEIWAHHTLLDQLHRQNTVTAVTYTRAMRQFGVLLPELVSSGKAATLRYGEGRSTGLIYPTKLMYEAEKDITIAGLNMTLVHIPGETSDQIGVWLPDKRAFMCADDIYKAFPNLYAIRGTPSRNVMQWVTSLDKMRDLKPQYLVPSHTRPLTGERQIDEILTVYRDAIQLIHDQTVRYMNKGLMPKEIAKLVKLPPKLAEHPYLKEFYGTIEWSVKGVFDLYLGWFSGDPVELSPFTPNEKAEHVIALAGGVSATLRAARTAVKLYDWQWALELASHVFRLDPSNTDARSIRRETMIALASKQTSVTGRNYYLTVPLEDHNVVENRIHEKTRANAVMRMPLKDLFMAMVTRLKAEECGNVNKSALFHFTDTEQNFTITIRNAIAVLSTGATENWTFKVTTTSRVSHSSRLL